ncbi:uncharacterized protein LOC132241830 [Myotis daubentonii]|uniref:uncharacterized protein LOC132241830 n=1 Tax=Myotis daubentonii TaxID=98922 RepID=UPI00287341E0|nr:uncharacterized protein LOC132241830 [Myotis daubentonii]
MPLARDHAADAPQTLARVGGFHAAAPIPRPRVPGFPPLAGQGVLGAEPRAGHLAPRSPPIGARGGPESAQEVGRGSASNRGAQGRSARRSRLRLVVRRTTLEGAGLRPARMARVPEVADQRAQVSRAVQREWKGGGETEEHPCVRERHRLVAPARPGSSLQPRYRPLTGNRTQEPSVRKPAFSPLSHTGQGCVCHVKARVLTLPGGLHPSTRCWYLLLPDPACARQSTCG